MEPLTIGFITALTAGFFKVGEKILERALDSSLDTPAQDLRKWLYTDYDHQKAEDRLREAAQAALAQAAANLPAGGERLRLVLSLTDQPPEVYELLAATAVGMVKPEPRFVPNSLLEILQMSENDQESLAGFLFDLRTKLLFVEGYEKLILYANELDRRNLLERTVNELAGIAITARLMYSYLKALAGRWGLNSSDKDALDEYLKDCLKDWGDLALPLIRRRTDAGKPVRLKEVFVPLYLRDLEAEEKMHRQIGNRQRRGDLPENTIEDEKVIPLDLKGLLTEHEAFILIGPPGSGKTTLLRRAALAFVEGNAKDDLQWNGKPLFPIFLRLRNFSDYLTLPENQARFVDPAPGALIAYLENLYKHGERILLTHDFFDRRLKGGDCIILLDGLDEVTHHRDLVAQQVNAFIKAFKPFGNRFGLSSRPRGYEGNTRLLLKESKLAIVVVTPLEPTGIRHLINNLLEILVENRDELLSHKQRLPQRILDSRELTEIAGNPLFCSALVQVYLYHKAELPERRVDVLDEILVLLLGFWEISKPVSKPGELGAADGTTRQYREMQEAVEYKLRRLRRLANYMHTELCKYEIERPRAIEVLVAYFLEKERVKSVEEAETWSKEFLHNSHERSGLLVESNPETETNPSTYAFVHQSFMEFLAATELVNQPGLVQTLVDHIDDPWWEQVILMAGAHPKTPDYQRGELIECLVQESSHEKKGSTKWQRRLTMAGHLARDMAGHLAGPEHQLIEDALHEAMIDNDLKPTLRANLADVLDEIYLPPDLDTFIRIPASLGQEEFYISKYLFTNSQYQRFLEAPDFAEPRYWSGFPRYAAPDEQGICERMGDWGDKGYRWLLGQLEGVAEEGARRVVYPPYWTDPRFGITRRGAPLVGITWYEANAYCRWLELNWSRQSESQANPIPAPFQVRLPTEAEWERAAGKAAWLAAGKGAEWKTAYPWQQPGDPPSELDEILRCANVDESGIHRTTPVGMYPLGASYPYELHDLAGNAWEWQANYYDKDQDVFSLRGGAWGYRRGLARLSERRYGHPVDAWWYYGFRLLVSPS